MKDKIVARLPIWFVLARVQHERLHRTIRIVSRPEQMGEDRCILGRREVVGRFATQVSILRP
jgi:hypothetical protein